MGGENGGWERGRGKREEERVGRRGEGMAREGEGVGGGEGRRWRRNSEGRKERGGGGRQRQTELHSMLSAAAAHLEVCCFVHDLKLLWVPGRVHILIRVDELNIRPHTIALAP